MISRIYASLMRHVSDCKGAMTTKTGIPIEYHAWESRGEEDKLPAKTLIGIDGFNFVENGGLWVVRMSIVLSSYQDINLMREFELLDILHKWFGEGAKVPLRDMDTGEENNELVVGEFEITPMMQSMLRNYRVVSLELLRTSGD